MAFFSVLSVTPTTEDWIPRYLPAANALVVKHGGRYLARTATLDLAPGTVRSRIARGRRHLASFLGNQNDSFERRRTSDPPTDDQRPPDDRGPPR